MEDPALKNRRRKNDGVLDDAASPTHPPLKTVKREEDATDSSKNAVADVRNDEEVGRQSAVSSGRREPEPSSPEVLELRQLLVASKQHSLNLEQELVHASQMLINWEQQAAKNEEMYQRACQTARGAESRVFDELKRNELEEKIADLTNNLAKYEKLAEKELDLLNTLLDEQRNEAKRANKKGDDLKRQLEDEKKDRRRAYEKVDELKKKLEEERKDRRRAYERGDDLKKQLEEEVKDRRRANEIRDELKEQLEEERKEGRRARERIDNLKLQLSKCGGPSVEFGIYTTAHNSDIFNLLYPTVVHSMSIDEAAEKMRAAFEKCGEETHKRMKTKKCPYNCELCGVETPKKLEATTHFLSKEHIEKVHASNTCVSALAVHNWTKWMEQMTPKKMEATTHIQVKSESITENISE